MTLVHPVLLDMVKPPHNIFRSGATASGSAVIQQPMPLPRTFQNGALFGLAPAGGNGASTLCARSRRG